MVRRWCLALAALAAWLAAGSGALARSVDLALVLAVDVSGSVSGERFELQRRGYAKAFSSPEVLDAIAAGQNHAILVTLVEWSGADHQQQTVGWTLIDGPETAAAFGSAVAEAPRAFADWTSISGAIDYAAALFAKIDVEAARKIIDVSGDGINNSGRELAAARADALRAGLTINGLAILWDYPTLDVYYRNNVIGGPGAFAVVAHDFSDFGAALLSKLVREIAGAKRPAGAKGYAGR
ncbi:MAG TPA: DUF1194 domain-containing protein [Stellaceae bacterium]|nr:DUF1194 domain-containing protein [Stellaceae bacterium]